MTGRLTDPEGHPENAGRVTFHTPDADDLDWVIRRHGAVYAAEYGWDARFERLVADVVAGYAAAPVGPGNRGWIARLDGERAGSIFLMPGPDATTLKLRLLLVEPTARGHGIGGRLVRTCIEAARESGADRLILWTDAVLVDARRLYECEGFVRTATERHAYYDVRGSVGETWTLEPLRGARC